MGEQPTFVHDVVKGTQSITTSTTCSEVIAIVPKPSITNEGSQESGSNSWTEGRGLTDCITVTLVKVLDNKLDRIALDRVA